MMNSSSRPFLRQWGPCFQAQGRGGAKVATNIINIFRGSLFAHYHSDHPVREAPVNRRVRLSQLWVPTGGIAASINEDGHSKLIRAGFLRQAHSGIFHMLPLGRRVQDKLEKLIDKYMLQLGASRLALSSISSEQLWSRSGRLKAVGSELFRFADRKDTKYLLSPTHEEEITTLVSSLVKSYKELPVRLYQISRKYRDERRPRHGLLRSREFVMKDLYTFDYDPKVALETYHEVRKIYARLFDELKLPYLIAEADSGDIGGNLSHEFHFPTSKGEDHVISCSGCDYIANEELAQSLVPNEGDWGNSGNNNLSTKLGNIQVWRSVSRDRLTLINVWFPSSTSTSINESAVPSDINIHAVKAILPDVDFSVDNAIPIWAEYATLFSGQAEIDVPAKRPRLLNVVDCRLPDWIQSSIKVEDPRLPLWPSPLRIVPAGIEMEVVSQDPLTKQPINLLRIRDGDLCPRCSGGTLRVQRAIELGHTFHLGTRYSEPLGARIVIPSDTVGTEAIGVRDLACDEAKSIPWVAMEMGCHGIGVSRMIGAVADTLADEKGLNWPRVMAPFEVVIVPTKGLDEAALEVYDALDKTPNSNSSSQLDLIIDDRTHSFPWKMRDADLVGYPVVVVVGRSWETDRMCEVQCRRLQLRQEVLFQDLLGFIHSLLLKL